MSRSIRKPIPYGRQTIDESDIEAVRYVLNQEFLTQGPAVGAFEAGLKNSTTARHVSAVSSATAALHLAYKGLGLAENEAVWTSRSLLSQRLTRHGSAGPALILSISTSRPVTCAPRNWQTNLNSATRMANSLSLSCLSTSAVPVVIWRRSETLANRYEVEVVEDASHALGGSYRSQPVGSCKFSDAAVFSFHPVKMITTGEGGCVTTNRDSLAEAVGRLRSHGITKTDTEFSSQSDGGWYYEQQELGLNYRITDIQASLGLSQLQRLEAFVEARNQVASWYHQFLPSEATPVRPLSGTRSSYHLFMIQLPTADLRRKVYDYLHDHDIRVQVHHTSTLPPVLSRPRSQTRDYPDAEQFYSRVLSLPIFPELTEAEVELVCTTTKEALGS